MLSCHVAVVVIDTSVYVAALQQTMNSPSNPQHAAVLKDPKIMQVVVKVKLMCNAFVMTFYVLCITKVYDQLQKILNVWITYFNDFDVEVHW